MEITNRYPGRMYVRRISAATFRSWLTKLGLSQMECARMLNVDPRSVRAWALGERTVPGPAICALELMFVVEKIPMPKPPTQSRTDARLLPARLPTHTRRRAPHTAAGR